MAPESRKKRLSREGVFRSSSSGLLTSLLGLHDKAEADLDRCDKLPLVDRWGRLNVEMTGFPKSHLYWSDLFHTLVNMPNNRFHTVLIVAYLLLFVVFAVPYYFDARNNDCIPGVKTFIHAIWFSVQTSMTIGYGGDLEPNPACFLTNVMVALQSVVSLLLGYSLLGVVYVRFSRPAKRAQTLKFSRNMVLYEEDGLPCLAFRVANVRKHQVIEAHVRMLVAINRPATLEDESVFRFTSLPLLGGGQIFLGLPCIVAHPITPSSPLYGLTFEMMEQCDMEILILLEAVDASTSAKLQARCSYLPCDIKANHCFSTMVSRRPSGRRCVDFTHFDTVVSVTPTVMRRPLRAFSFPDPPPSISAASNPRAVPPGPPHFAVGESIASEVEPSPSWRPPEVDELARQEGLETAAAEEVGGGKHAGVDYSVGEQRRAALRRLMLTSSSMPARQDGAALGALLDTENRLEVAEAEARRWRDMYTTLAIQVQSEDKQVLPVLSKVGLLPLERKGT